MRAHMRPGERMLSTKEGVRLVEQNLGRRKFRYDSALYAYRIDRSGIELLLRLPHPERLAKIMHRIRILATTEFNRSRGTVGFVRWERGFEAEELSRPELSKAARRLGRPRATKVLLGPLP